MKSFYPLTKGIRGCIINGYDNGNIRNYPLLINKRPKTEHGMRLDDILRNEGGIYQGAFARCVNMQASGQGKDIYG